MTVVIIWLAIIVFQLLRIEHHLAVIRLILEQPDPAKRER